MGHGATTVRRALLCCLLGCWPAAAFSQPVIDEVQELAFDAPESWAMKTFASIALLTGLGVPDRRPAGSVELQLELSSVPRLSAEQRTVGFGGTKTEDLNRTSVFGRPRVLVGLPAGFTVEVSYLPAIDISGIEPELFAAALARPLLEGRRFRLGARLTAQHGTFTGDLTCSRDEIASGANPFDCERPSDDEMTLDTGSLELTGSLEVGSEPRWRPYLALAAHRMDLDFRVDARYAGLIDRTRLLTDGTTLSLALGAELRLGERGRLAGEVFWAPLEVVRPPSTTAEGDDLLHLRVAYRYRLR